MKHLKENESEFYICRICAQIVDTEHFKSEEHIEKFNSVYLLQKYYLYGYQHYLNIFLCNNI